MKRMKSILFTVEEVLGKLVDGRKTRTFRTKFIPDCRIGETVKIDFKYKEYNLRWTLHHAKIVEIYPKQIRDVSEHEARLDGFEMLEDFKVKIKEINGISGGQSDEQWGFFIAWENVKSFPLKRKPKRKRKTLEDFT